MATQETASCDSIIVDIESGTSRNNIDNTPTTDKANEHSPLFESSTTPKDTNTDVDTASSKTISSETDTKDTTTPAAEGSSRVSIADGTEAIPATSMRQTAMSGFAGLGCTLLRILEVSHFTVSID